MADKEQCSNCHWWRETRPYRGKVRDGWCVVLPTHIRTKPEHWCGQWRAKAEDDA